MSKSVRLHERRWVRRPQREVFAYTADFSNIENWDPGVIRSDKVGDRPIGVGSEFLVEVKFGLATDTMTYVISEYEPDSRVLLTGRSEKLTAVDEIRFASEGDMTMIEYTADLTFTNLMRYFVPLMRSLLKRIGERAVDGLAAALDR